LTWDREPHHLGDAHIGDLDVEGAGNVQRLAVFHPGKRNVIVGPMALDGHRDFMFAGAFERPIIRRCHEFDHVHRIGVPFELEIAKIHAPPGSL
jgi:hypothetical protein